MDDWVSLATFEFYIRYIYTGKLSLDISDELWDVSNKSRKKSIDDFTSRELIDFYKFAHYTKNEQLEKLLLVDHIIPRMNVEMALYYLKTRSLKRDLIILENLRESEQILMDYSCFFVARHLPKQLVEKRLEFHDIDKNILIQIIHKSFRYLQGGHLNQFGDLIKTNNKDLELIVQFAAENITDRDVFRLLRVAQNKFSRCFAFDQQNISQLKEFISSIDINETYYCDLTLSDQIQNSKSIFDNKQGNEIMLQSEKGLQINKSSKQFLQQLLDIQNLDQQKNDRTFYQNETINQNLYRNNRQMNETMNQDKYDVTNQNFDFQQWNTFNNFLPEQYQTLMKSTDDPSFSYVISLNEIKERMNETSLKKGLTIISNAFDSSRRSWHLKIDINLNLEMSLWIVERGLPVGLNEYNENFSIPFFSSVILEFKVISKSIDQLYCPIFFSFSHNSNQCIGVEKVFNLSQIQSNESIQIQVNLKENILHSGVMNYISQNFEKYLNNYLNSFQDEQQNGIYHKSEYQKSGIMNMPFPQIYQLLLSNNLKIECENTILTYMFHFCSQDILFKKYNNRKTCQYVIDLIAQTLRFCFVDVHNILSAIRKCEGLRTSKIFQQLALNEMWMRISSSQSKDSSHSYINDKEYQLRCSFNLNKIKYQGRFKNQNDNDKDEKEKMLELIQQVFNWAITASEIQLNSTKESKKEVKIPAKIEHKNQRDQINELSHRAIYRGQLSDLNINVQNKLKEKRNNDQQINEKRRRLDEYPKQNFYNYYSKQLPQNQNRNNQNIPKFLQIGNKENEAPNKDQNRLNFSSIQFTLGSIESKKQSSPCNKMNSTYIAERKIKKEREVREFTNILNQLSPIKNRSLDDSRLNNSFKYRFGDNYQVKGSLGNYQNPFILKDLSKNNQYQMKTKLPYGRNNYGSSHQRSNSLPVFDNIVRGMQWGLQQIQKML